MNKKIVNKEIELLFRPIGVKINDNEVEEYWLLFYQNYYNEIHSVFNKENKTVTYINQISQTDYDYNFKVKLRSYYLIDLQKIINSISTNFQFQFSQKSNTDKELFIKNAKYLIKEYKKESLLLKDNDYSSAMFAVLLKLEKSIFVQLINSNENSKTINKLNSESINSECVSTLYDSLKSNKLIACKKPEFSSLFFGKTTNKIKWIGEKGMFRFFFIKLHSRFKFNNTDRCTIEFWIFADKYIYFNDKPFIWSKVKSDGHYGTLIKQSLVVKIVENAFSQSDKKKK